MKNIDGILNVIAKRKVSSLMMLLILIAIPFGSYLVVKNKWIFEPLSIGQTLPSAMIKTLDGKEIATNTLIVKKSIIIIISITCPACKNEISNIASLYSSFINSFDIIAISLSREQETKDFILDMNILFPVYLDEKNEAKYHFRINLIPAMLFVNEKQQLIKYQAGGVRIEQLKSTLVHFASLNPDSSFIKKW